MLKHSHSTGKMKRKVFSPFEELKDSNKAVTSSDEEEPKPKVGITQDSLQIKRGPSSSAGFINRSPKSNSNSSKVLIRQRKFGHVPLKTIESCSSADVSGTEIEIPPFQELPKILESINLQKRENIKRLYQLKHCNIRNQTFTVSSNSEKRFSLKYSF